MKLNQHSAVHTRGAGKICQVYETHLLCKPETHWNFSWVWHVSLLSGQVTGGWNPQPEFLCNLMIVAQSSEHKP